MKRNHQKPSPNRLFRFLFFTAALCFFTCAGFTSSAQSVGVGTASPNASAILDVTSTTKGVLYPRMTTTQRNAITSPATGLTIFNTTTNCLEFYVGSAWQPIACGCTAAPSTPSSIVGTLSSLCKTPTTYTYSVPAVLGASSYTWAVTGDASATIVGQGANVVTVTYSGTTGTAITAYASNSCGNSSTTSSAISFLVAPSAPGTISYTGSASGTNFCTSATATFSVTNVAGLTYNWTLPSGCTITAGSGTNSITATLSSSVVSSGAVSVTASNCNATGSASTLTINIGTGGSPSAPGTISYTGNVTGPSTPTFCKSGTATFSVASVTGATSYNWTLPSGCSITSGSGTNSITASLSSSVITGGTVSVTATNCLGTSSASTLTINSGTGKVVYAYTGSGQTFTVPCGVTSLTVKLWGAGGGGASSGGSGGSAAYVAGSLAVTAGNTLTLIVGGGGNYGASTQVGTGGYGGGGSTPDYGGGGGGRSSIQLTAGTDYVTAGGGGGGGWYGSSTYGGAGGATTGGTGGARTAGSFTGGVGGTTSAGGAGGLYNSASGQSNAGTALTGASSFTSGMIYYGGGGGGGYYGGGSGYSGISSTNYCSGGGGGSSYTTNLTSVTNTAGNINSSQGIATAPNNSDVDYVSGVGIGTYTSPTTGGNGLIVLSW